MNLRIDVYHHFPSSDSKLDQIITAIKELGDKMSVELDNLKTAVASEDTVIASAITLLNGLSAQIAVLKDDPAALQALADDVAAQAKSLGDAVTANTPSA